MREKREGGIESGGGAAARPATDGQLLDHDMVRGCGPVPERINHLQWD